MRNNGSAKIVVIILALAVVLGVGYLIGTKKVQVPGAGDGMDVQGLGIDDVFDGETNNRSVAQDEMVSWEVYIDEKSGVKFKHPKEWSFAVRRDMIGNELVVLQESFNPDVSIRFVRNAQDYVWESGITPDKFFYNKSLKQWQYQAFKEQPRIQEEWNRTLNNNPVFLLHTGDAGTSGDKYVIPIMDKDLVVEISSVSSETLSAPKLPGGVMLSEFRSYTQLLVRSVE